MYSYKKILSRMNALLRRLLYYKTILQRQVDATEEDKVEGSDLDFTQGYHVSSFAGVS